MKILLKAYTQLNVGDDLFIDILCRRYPDAQFVLAAQTSVNYDKFISAHPNLEAFCGHSLTYRIMRRLHCAPLVEKRIIRDFDAVIHIGGSIFMENESNRYLERVMEAETAYCKKMNIPYYVLSSNFGPYATEGYKDRMRACFARCEDVCFREMESYEKFCDIPSVRYAPDAAFSRAVKKTEVRGDVLGVVPICYKNRDGGEVYGKKYTSMLAQRIKEQLKSGASAEIFCFCTAEGDAVAAEDIIKALGGCTGVERVSVHMYDGDLDGFISRYLSCGKIIASRFHAILLALMCKIPLIPHIYSKKTENVLEDMELYGKIDFESFMIYSLPSEYLENAQKMWEKTDKLYAEI